MEEKIKIILSLGDVESVSDLKKIVYEEELEEINSKHPLNEGKIDIHGTYFLKNDNILETGFFIRNGLKNSLSLERVMLSIEDTDGNKIVTQIFNLKQYGVILSYTGRPFEVNFDFPEGSVFDETKEYIIKFDEQIAMKGFSSVETKLENLPKNLPYEQEKAIRDFEKSLPTLKENGFTISLYKLVYNNNRALNCIILFRNGKDSEGKVEKLPVSVFDKDGVLIARTVFSNNEGLVKVSSYKSVVKTFEFPPKDVEAGIHELESCRVEFK